MHDIPVYHIERSGTEILNQEVQQQPIFPQAVWTFISAINMQLH